MTPEETLSAYKRMRADLQAEYDAACRTMEEQKAQGREKSVTFRTAFARKLACQEMLERYKTYGL